MWLFYELEEVCVDVCDCFYELEHVGFDVCDSNMN